MRGIRRIAFVGSVVCAAAWTMPALAAPLAYVTDPVAGTLTAIDLANDSIVRTVSGLPGADAVAVSASGSRIYVAERTAGAIAVLSRDATINPAASPVVQTLAVGGAPVALALDPTNSLLYDADAASDSVLEVDLATGSVKNTYPTSSGLDSVALSPSGLLLAYATSGNDTVQIVRTGRTTAISLGSAPTALSFAPDGETLWIADAGGFASYALASGAVKNETIAGGTTSAVFDVRNKLAYFGAATGNRVYSYAPAGGTVSSIAVGGPVSGLALSPDGSRLYAVQSCAGCGVAVIDTAKQQQIAQVAFGQSPQTSGNFAGPGEIVSTNLVINVFANHLISGVALAHDGASRSLVYQLVKGPGVGELRFSGNGNWMYAPPIGYSGAQTFVWQAAAATGVGSPTLPVSRPISETVAVYPISNALPNQIVPPGGAFSLPLDLIGSVPIKVSFTSSNATVVDPASISTTPGCGSTTLDCTIVAPVTASVGTSATITMTLTDPSGLQSRTKFSVSVQNRAGGGAIAPMVLAALLGLLLLLGGVRRRHA